MKTLNEILNESLLDADFDVGVEDIYADNITNKVIEIISSPYLKNSDKVIKELYNLLKSAAREQQHQNVSILKRLRTEDNTSIFMSRTSGIQRRDMVNMFIRRFRKGMPPLLKNIQLFKQANGSSRVCVWPTRLVPHPAAEPQPMKETLVFSGPGVWDEIVNAYGQR